MNAENVADLTVAELKQYIDESIDHAIENYRGAGNFTWPGQDHSQPVEKVLEWMRKNVWTPPPGAKSSLELLLEDRDR